MSGVTVFVYPSGGYYPSGHAVTTVTDGSGRYSTTFNSLFLIPDLVVSVHTEKSGYESADYYNGPISRSPGASTFVRDLAIYRIRHVPVGQSTTIEVKVGDPECAITDNVPADGELRVYLEVMPPNSGTYSFTLTSTILP